MTKKGFTLIELMGVIIILGVLGLVVFPSILNQMKKVDVNLSNATKKIIYSAADEYITEHKSAFEQKLQNDEDIYLSIPRLVTEGYLNKDINFKNYKYIRVSVRNGVTYEYKLLQEGTHDLSETIADGTEIYFNPNTGMKCDYSEAKTGDELIEGCMVWYAFGDSGKEVNLILNHNSSLTDVPDIDVLNEDVRDWNDTVKNTARFIKAEEVAKIMNFNFADVTNNYGEFGIEEIDRGWWLLGYNFDNIDTTGHYTWGYWISNPTLPDNDNCVWGIFNIYSTYGMGCVNPELLPNFFGVRPVITILKSSLA